MRRPTPSSPSPRSDMFDTSTLAFAGVALILTITPGADTMLVVRSVLARGAKAGLLTTAGINLGLFLHASISGVGLSILLVQSAGVFHAVKGVGAWYLVYLGFDSLRSAWRSRREEGAVMPPTSGLRRRAFLEGLMTNVLNPKVAVFYLAFLPQFIEPGDSVLAKSLLLAGIHAAMGVVWLCLVTLLLGRLRSLISGGTLQRRLEAAGGVILIALGIRLAAE